jgi:glycine hydroxymethyltransferase
VPFDPRKPWSPSGMRLGTAAITTRGLTEEHMASVAEWIDRALTAAEDRPALDQIAAEIQDLMNGFPMPGWAPVR